MRSPTISRLYLQVPAGRAARDWPDDADLGGAADPRSAERRLARQRGPDLREGHHADAQLRVRADAVRAPVPGRRRGPHRPADRRQGPEPRRQRRAACSPRRSIDGTATGDAPGSTRYSDTALRRVWRAQDFSNYMTQLLHDLGGGPFERELQLSRLEYLARSTAAAHEPGRELRRPAGADRTSRASLR